MLGQKVPEEERFANADAERGTLLHRADEEGTTEGLELSDADFLVQARKIEEGMYNQWIEDHGITEPEIIREQRFWLNDGTRDLCSAKLDLLVVAQSQGHGLIIDLKSGRKAVTPPVRNWQLRTAVAIVSTVYGLSNIRVGIAAPYMTRQPLADYDPAAIFASVAQLDQLIEEIENPDARRTAGAWCNHCPARHICPEAQAYLNKVVALDGLRWRNLPAERKFELYQLCEAATAMIAAIRENIKAELKQNAASIPGLTLSKPTHPRAIHNAIDVYLTLQKEFPDVEINSLNDAFNRSVKVKISELETFYREVHGCTKADAAAWLNRVCAPIITTSTREGHVELAK